MMSLGKTVRNIAGPRLFRVLGSIYRSVFVDLQKVAQSVAPHIPQGAHVLDVGGGDGEPMNRLLKLRPDITVTMIGISGSLGCFLEPELASRVDVRPSTSISQYVDGGGKRPDCVLLSDVIHHIPADDRDSFFADLERLVGRTSAIVVIKDIEPGHLRARLALLADRYISGDKGAALIAARDVEVLVRRHFDRVTTTRSRLMDVDPPNYASVFHIDSQSVQR
jgi:cyclopropane fatty-acyl-phospholipid synthase-like methyltransferase